MTLYLPPLCPLYPRKRTCAVQLADVRYVPEADMHRRKSRGFPKAKNPAAWAGFLLSCVN